MHKINEKYYIFLKTKNFFKQFKNFLKIILQQVKK